MSVSVTVALRRNETRSDGVQARVPRRNSSFWSGKRLISIGTAPGTWAETSLK